MDNYRINRFALRIVGTLSELSTLEREGDFEECFEALNKSAGILSILKTDRTSVANMGHVSAAVDSTLEAAFARSQAAKEASAKQREGEAAALAKVEKEADAPPSGEEKPKRGRKPKASEDAPAEEQAIGETPPPADAPAKPKINEILWWDGENQDHRKVLIMILKEDHGWDSKTPENIALASLVKTELQKCEIDHTRQDLIRAKVGEIVEDLKVVIAKKNSEVKAPF